VSELFSRTLPLHSAAFFLTVLTLALGACAAFAAAPAGACTSPCHWYEGSLSNGFGQASGEAHSLTYVQGNANHNEFCIGEETGNAGSYKDNGGDCQVFSNGTFAASDNYDGSCCFHATIVNTGPLSTISVTSATHYDY
jgi:hypothetical protein